MTEKTQAKCPICGKPAVVRYRPFCSQRCSDLDLGRWLKESYVIPGTEPVTNDNEPGDED